MNPVDAPIDIHKASSSTASHFSSGWMTNWLNSYWNKGIYPHSKLCSKENCLRHAIARSLCNRHREQWRYRNDPKAMLRRDALVKTKRLKRQQNPEWVAWRKQVEAKKAGEEISKIFREPKKSPEERRLCQRYTLAIYECNKRKKLRFKWLINFEDFKMLCQQACFYCGGVLGNVKYGKGLDRIDSKKDYTLDNVYPCCNTCNRIKGDDLTAEEVKSMVGNLLLMRQTKNAKA